MSIPKIKPTLETKNNSLQKEDIQNHQESMAEKLAEKMHDQFINEKAIDIESLAHRYFAAANPSVVNTHGDAYILHPNGTKTLLKPEDLNNKSLMLSDGDIIITGPESSVVVEAAGKQCIVEENNQLPIQKAVLLMIDSGDSSIVVPCPTTEIVEDEGSNTFIINDHWQSGIVTTAYSTLTDGILHGTLSGDYAGFLSDTPVLSALTDQFMFEPLLPGELRGEVGLAPIGPLVLGGPEAEPIVAPAAAPPEAPPINPNVPPVASDSVVNGGEDQVVTFSLAMFNSTDGNIGDSVESITIHSLPTDGILEFDYNDGNGFVPVVIDGVSNVIPAGDIGNLRYTPDTNESGDDSFSTLGVGNLSEDYANFDFSVSDGEVDSNVATMTINVAPIADTSVFISFDTTQQPVFSPLYLADSSGGSTSIYTVEFNTTTNEAELTFLTNAAGFSDAQMAVTQDASRIYLLDSDTSNFGYYDTTNNTFNSVGVTGSSVVGGMTFFADDTGNELLYIYNDTTNSLAAYDVSSSLNLTTPIANYGPFDIVDPLTGLSTGAGNFDFNGGDIIFDEFGQAYAVSNSLNNLTTGGLVKLNLDNGTAVQLQDFSDWTQGVQTGLANVTGLQYDPVTHTFGVVIESSGPFVRYQGTQVDSAVISLDINGNYIFPNGPANPPTLNMTEGGLPFTHTNGDTGSADAAQYAFSIGPQLIDTDGSEAFTSLSLNFGDSDNHVDGATLVYNGQIIGNGSVISLNGFDGSFNPIGPVQATVSVDPIDQVWTFTITTPDPTVINIGGDFAVRIGLSQFEDFQIALSATSTELSNGSNLTSTYNYPDVPIDFVPVINDGAALIIHDEDSGEQPGTNDVDIGLTPPAAIVTFEANNSLSHIGAANSGMGVFAYQAPGGDYIADIRLTQSGGTPFSNDGVLGGVDSGIQTAGGINNIFLYQDPSDNNLLIGREGVGAVENPAGAIILSIYLDGGLAEFGSPNDSVWLHTYAPIENASAPAIISGLIHLTVETNDGNVVTSSDSIDFQILENDNDAPVTQPSSFTVGEDLTHVFTLADFPSTDADVGDAVDFVRFDTLPISGTIQLNGINITAGQSISVTDINNGLLTYTGAFDQSGDPSFGVPGTGDQQNQYALATFSVSDGQVFSGTPSQMSVEVTPIADAPIMGAALATTTTRFSTLYLSDAGPTIPNPDFDDPSQPNDQANLGGQAVAGVGLYTLEFDDRGTADLNDDIVKLTLVGDFWSLQNPTADPAFLNQRVDGRLEVPGDPLLGPVVQDPDGDGQIGLPPPPSRDDQLSDVGYTSASIAAVLDGSQIFALDDTRVDSASRLDFGFAEVNTSTGAVTGFTNISGPDFDANTPDGIGHSPTTTVGAQGMTFFGGGGQQQIFIYNVATDQVQAYDISGSLAPIATPPGPTTLDPFASGNLVSTFGAGGGVGFTIIESRDLYSGADLTGFGTDANSDNIGDSPDGVGDTLAPDGVGDYNGFFFDISSGDIIFDQYDQAYMISNSRKSINDLGGPNQVGGFAKLNLEDGTAVLLNDFRDTFNLFADSDGSTPGKQIAKGMVGAGGLFLDAGADIDGDGIADGAFYFSLAGNQRFSIDGTLANDQQISSTFIILDRQGNILAFPDMTDATGTPNSFTHAGGGDGTSTLQIEYTVPIVAAVSDTDGSESLTQFTINLNDANNFVDGGVLRFGGDELLNNGAFVPGMTVDLDGIVNGANGIDNVHATLVSYDGVDQLYTFSVDQSGGVVSSINDMNGITVTANGNQTTDFSMHVEATSTELSNLSSATGFYDINVDRGGLPQIDAVGSISIDETPLKQTTDDSFGKPVDDINQTDLTAPDSHNLAEAIINHMQTDIGLSTPDTIARTQPGEMLYTVANSFAGDVTMTDSNGNAFNGVDSGLTSVNGNTIFLYTYSYNFSYTDPVTSVVSTINDDNIILGREGGFGGDPNLADPNGAVVFSLFYDEGLAQFGAANDSLWLTMYDTILHENPGQALSIDNLIYLKVFDSTLSTSAVSGDAIRVTFVDDTTTGGIGDPDGPDPFPPAAPFMMMSAFSAGDGPVSNEDASSSFMTVSNDDSSSLLFATVSNDDASTVNNDSTSTSSTDSNSSPSQDSSATGSDQSLTTEMVFDTTSQDNPVQAEQQAALDGSSTQPQEEVAQQQQTQEATVDPSPASAPDPVSQSMQEADQQAQQSSGG